jgi:hypothetical protein
MERPEIENFIQGGLVQAHNEYRTAPGLFAYAASLENYVDWILEQRQGPEIDFKVVKETQENPELKKALQLLRDLADLQNGPWTLKTFKKHKETLEAAGQFLKENQTGFNCYWGNFSKEINACPEWCGEDFCLKTPGLE